MDKHHAKSYYFLLILYQDLTYLCVDIDTAYQKKTYFRGKNMYQENNNYGRSLIDAGFIPYNVADPASFVDVVDDDYKVFTPEIINAVDDNYYKQEEEEED